MSYIIETQDGGRYGDGTPSYVHHAEYRTWTAVCEALSLGGNPLWWGYTFRITDSRSGLTVVREDITEWVNAGYPQARVANATKKSLPWAASA